MHGYIVVDSVSAKKIFRFFFLIYSSTSPKSLSWGSRMSTLQRIKVKSTFASKIDPDLKVKQT